MATKINILIILLFLIIPFQIKAQNDCADNLANSQKLFEDGDFRNSIIIMEKLLDECDLNRTQENEVLKLLASANYEMDEIEIGNKYVEKFLRKNPFYIASKKSDPYTFIETLDKFKSWPRFSVGIRAGMPLIKVYTQKIYPILDTANYLNNYYTSNALLGMLEFAWNINKYLSVNIGFGLRTQKIIHEVPMYNNEIVFNYEESSLIGNTPLYVQFTLPTKSSFTGAIYVGAEVNALSRASYSYIYTSDGISDEFASFLNKKRININIDINERNLIRKALIFGGKFIYKINKFSIFADVRYIKDFDLYNNPDKHFVNPDLYFTNSYTLSDIKLETIDFSLGFTFNFSYKVKPKY
ncbi:MAG: hypothetical protein JXR51_14865 [Bacteroidales bacterium]|nr:hypothetical protein [Bacteroidales bacterium]MBN2758452.1 hypothetical protein [Bacteroidales bacterium]